MSTIINARSPYYLRYSNALLDSVELSIYIYPGIFGTSKPASPQYTVTKSIITGNTYVVYEIAELIRDYISFNYGGTSNDGIWVETNAVLKNALGGTILTDTDYFLSFDGYGYFEEGVNPRQSTDPADLIYTPMALQTNRTEYFVKGRDVYIPAFSEASPIASTTISSGTWAYVDRFGQTGSGTSIPNNITLSDTTVSTSKISWLRITSDNIDTNDTVTLVTTSGSGEPNIVLTFQEICEGRYENYRVIFINKFGAMQGLWFTQKSTTTTNIKKENYNSNIIDVTSSPVTYGITKHAKKTFQIKANQSIKLNSPYYDEGQNDSVEQMLMSESVWIEGEYDSATSTYPTYPVTVKTSSLERKIGANDMVQIQYQVEFDFAYERINNIR